MFLGNKPFGTAGYTVLLALYLTLNSLLNLMNKWVLNWFSFPLLLTACHMAFSFLLLLPPMLAEPMQAKHATCLKKQWKGLCTIGVFLGLNISLNNTSLVGMTLSLNQVIRASIPVFTCLLSMLIEANKIPTGGEAASLAVLTGGVMLAMWKSNAAGSPFAIALCVAGTVCNAGMMSLSGRLMSEKVDVLQLTFYTAPVSFLAILPAFIYKELPHFLMYRKAHMAESYGVILATSVIALTYNLVHALMIQQTSAVTTTVIGQIKIIGLVILSAFLLGEKSIFTVNMTIGTCIALLGFMAYSYLKLQQRMKQHAGLPVQTKETAEPLLESKLVEEPDLPVHAETNEGLRSVPATSELIR